MAVRLVVLDGDKKIYHTLSDEITIIGRGSGCTLELADRNLSRQHCQIERIEGGWQVRDLDSQNGTRLNDQIINKATLRPGDMITIGRARLQFEDSDQSADGALARERIVKERDDLLKLLEINREVSGELHHPALLEMILDRVIEVTGAQRGFLILLDGEQMDFAVARNIEKHQIDQKEFRVSRSIIKQVAASGKPEILENALNDTRYGLEQSIIDQELVSVMCVPMLLKDKVLGLIYLGNDLAQRAFTSEQLSLLEAFAAQAAIAIENARLYEEVLVKQKELAGAKEMVDQLNEQLQEKLENQSREMVLIEKDHPKVALKYNYDNLIGRSKKMVAVFKLLDRVIETRITVLIQGESGTGKELVAKAIHYNGELKGKRFVGLNCAALTQTLLESELFGHVRGAFTGAVRDRKGLFEIADGGTIFLDEIGEMSPETQTKFLRVLQEGEFLPVGSTQPRHVTVRVIAASNKNLAEMVAAKRFREDLYYRLNVIPVQLPPLRDRKDDIPILVNHFLDKLTETAPPKRKVDAGCMRALLRYDWPGNVRELENEITRLVALTRGAITAEHLSEHVRAGGLARIKLSDLEGKSLKQIVTASTYAVEKEAILAALKASNFKKVRAARMLDISRPTLDVKIQTYGIDLKNEKNASNS